MSDSSVSSSCSCGSSASSRRVLLTEADRIVVKVGSSVLASLEGGIDMGMIGSLADQLSALHRQGRRPVLVSSGAVAAGCAELGLKSRPKDMPTVQAAAAVGQSALMQLYRNMFEQHGVKTAQVLLTRDCLHDRVRFLHARNTMMRLLEMNVLPIVNENDTVAVEELKLRVGDNDALAVAVCQLVDADCLLLLSDVPGLYDRPPSEGDAALITHVDAVDDAILAKAGGGGPLGMGGMQSKVAAAIGAGLGAMPLVVAGGRTPNVLIDIIAGKEVGTYFAPRKERTSSRQQWIAFGRKPSGTLVVDAGAERALVEGKKSLLAIGIREIQQNFEEGDTVRVFTQDGKIVARGLVNFSSEDLAKIAGRRNEEQAALLGYDGPDTVIHRDNLVIIKAETPNGQTA